MSDNTMESQEVTTMILIVLAILVLSSDASCAAQDNSDIVTNTENDVGDSGIPDFKTLTTADETGTDSPGTRMDNDRRKRVM